jgi:hypothetical protein
MKKKLGLASPWAVYAGRVEALFAWDGDVDVEFDNDARKLKVFVRGQAKADAISKLLPAQKEFGVLKLDIEVVPSNDEPSEEDVYRAAFHGNAAFCEVAEGYGPAGDVSYALFAPDTVQLREDDISEFGGLTTLTYAQLAESVLDAGDVLISSSAKE